MKMELQPRERIALAAAIGVLAALVTALALTLTHMTEAEESPESPEERTTFFGLLSVPEENTVAPITLQDREEEYASRQPLTAEIAATLRQQIARELSLGNFSSLDDTLRFYEETFRDGSSEEEQAESRMSAVTSYRRDLAVVLSGAAPLTGFVNPDVLAAAMVFRPLSARLDVLLNQDSACLPAVEEADRTTAALKEVELSIPEIQTALAPIRARMGDHAVTGLRLYTFQVCGHSCRLTLIAREDGTWAPYLEEDLTEGASPLTIGDMKELRDWNRNNDAFDVDSLCVLIPPEEVDPRGNEGVSGTGTAFPDLSAQPEIADEDPASDLDRVQQ